MGFSILPGWGQIFAGANVSGFKPRNLERFSALLGRFPASKKFAPHRHRKCVCVCVCVCVGDRRGGVGRCTKTGKSLGGQAFLLAGSLRKVTRFPASRFWLET